MFFVAGVTGHVGGATARSLLGAGKEVRTLVRDPGRATEWGQAGVELHVGELGNTAALSGALTGVEGAFVLVPPTVPPSPDFAEARATIDALRQAFAAAPPPRLVCLSSVGSEQPSGLGLITQTHLMEQAFADLPFPVAFVRPGSFYENFNAALGHAAETGVFDSFMQPLDKPFPMAATADIGTEVARLLTSGWSGDRHVVELGSHVTPARLAEAMAAVLEVPVTARAVPREHWEVALDKMGLPPGMIGPYAEMTDGINSGWIDWHGEGTRVEGTTSPEQVFAVAQGKTEPRDGHPI